MATNPSLRTTQTLVGALIAGIVVFCLTLVVILPSGGAPTGAAPAPNPALATTLLIPAAALAIVAVFVPALLGPRLVLAAKNGWERSSRDDAARTGVAAQFQVLCIMRAALAEGLGLLCTVAVLLTGQLAYFAGTGLSLLLMLAMFPTLGRWREFYRRVTGEELQDPA